MNKLRVESFHSLREVAELRNEISALDLSSPHPCRFVTCEAIGNAHVARQRAPLFLAAFEGVRLVGYLDIPFAGVGLLVTHGSDRPYAVARARDVARCCTAFHRAIEALQPRFSTSPPPFAPIPPGRAHEPRAPLPSELHAAFSSIPARAKSAPPPAVLFRALGALARMGTKENARTRGTAARPPETAEREDAEVRNLGGVLAESAALTTPIPRPPPLPDEAPWKAGETLKPVAWPIEESAPPPTALSRNRGALLAAGLLLVGALAFPLLRAAQSAPDRATAADQALPSSTNADGVPFWQTPGTSSARPVEATPPCQAPDANAEGAPTALTSAAAPAESPVAGLEAALSRDRDFDAAEASRTLAVAAGQAASCRAVGEPAGAAKVSVTFAPSGRATQASVNGPPFAGTKTGSCVADTLRTARVPAFVGSPVTVWKWVTVR